MCGKKERQTTPPFHGSSLPFYHNDPRRSVEYCAHWGKQAMEQERSLPPRLELMNICRTARLKIQELDRQAPHTQKKLHKRISIVHSTMTLCFATQSCTEIGASGVPATATSVSVLPPDSLVLLFHLSPTQPKRRLATSLFCNQAGFESTTNLRSAKVIIKLGTAKSSPYAT